MHELSEATLLLHGLEHYGPPTLMSGGDPAVADDRILAVLGHELGQVARRHVLRRLLQTAAVSLAATVLWGSCSEATAVSLMTMWASSTMALSMAAGSSVSGE